jgi:hypothetical protein
LVVPQEDRKLLISFLQRLQLFTLQELVLYSPQLPGGLADDLVSAWHLQDERFARARAVLELRPSPEHPEDEMNPGELERRLAEAGLVGPELQIKVRILDDAADAYAEQPSPTRFGDVLGAADVTLGSLTRVLTFMEPVKEVKEGIEFLFSRGRGWLRRLWRRRRQ